MSKILRIALIAPLIGIPAINEYTLAGIKEIRTGP